MTELEQAIAALKAGDIVAFPTETVYGLGADALKPQAVERIFVAKGRPADRPLTVHLGPKVRPQIWVEEWTTDAQVLADRFWPGPLTLILPKAAHVSDIVTGGLNTVGLRVPSHPLAIALLNGFGGGVAAPSANRSGTLSPTTAAHVRASLGSRVKHILDGGPCTIGLESTVLSLVGEPKILRQGALRAQDLSDVLEKPVIGGVQPTAPKIIAVCSLKSSRECQYRPNSPNLQILWCGTPMLRQARDLVLPNDAEGYGQGLYQALRDVTPGELWIECPPEGPAWDGIHSRLRLISGERDDAGR